VATRGDTLFESPNVTTQQRRTINQHQSKPVDWLLGLLKSFLILLQRL
jgi:hypothetical protein